MSRFITPLASRSVRARHLLPLAVIALLAALFGSGVALRAHADPATIVVTTSTDTIAADSQCSLREAIDAANGAADNSDCVGAVSGGPNTITFSDGITTITLAGSQLPKVATAITIEGGAGVTVDGNNASRILFVTGAGALTIGHMTLTGGSTTIADCGGYAGGGATCNDGGTVTLTNTTLSGNTAAVYGGAIDNHGGTVTLTNTTLSGNTSSWEGGAINNWAGGTVTLTNSTLSDNTAGYGGAISNYDRGSTLDITGGALSDNTATSVGGAIYTDLDTTVNITGGALSGNSAAFAGAIGNHGATLTVTNTTLSRNTATQALGGAIENWSGGTVTVTNSTLSGNTASEGGAIDSHDLSTLTVTNSTLSHNFASNLGGAIFSGGPATVTGSTLSGNTAGLYGGAIESRGGALMVIGSTLSSNTSEQGGAIYVEAGATLTVTNSILSSNTAENGGAYGGAIQGRGSTLMVTNSTLSDNTAAWGGAIANNDGSTLTVTNSTLSGNSAYAGGAMAQVDLGSTVSSSTFSNSTFSNNTADYGGAIEGYTGAVTAANSTFYGNSATAQGGAIDLTSGTAEVAGSIFAGNGAASCANLDAYTDNGYNVSDDASCTPRGAAAHDVSATIAQIGVGPLADNGGPTETMAITSDSAAFGIIPAAVCSAIGSTIPNYTPGTDQRGYIRLGESFGDAAHCDAGAFEVYPVQTKTTASATYLDDAPVPVVSMSATVVAVGISSIPAGTVAFYNGTTLLCTVTLDGSGTAQCVSAFSPASVAPHSLTVVYGTHGNFLGSQTTTDVVPQRAQPTIVNAEGVVLVNGPAWAVHGGGFSGTSSVTVCGVAVPFTVVNDNVLVIGIPALSGPQQCIIIVTAAGGTGSGGPVTVVPTPVPGSPSVVVPTGTTTPTSTPTPTTTPTTTPTANCTIITLTGAWTLIAWPGADESVADALSGDGSACANDITAQVAVIWSWDVATQTWQGYFPGVNTPGANDLTTLHLGAGYFVALKSPAGGSVSWKIIPAS